MVAYAISHKDTKPKRVRALQLSIHSSLPTQIRDAQIEAFKEENLKAESLLGMEKKLEHKEDDIYYFMKCVWAPGREVVSSRKFNPITTK